MIPIARFEPFYLISLHGNIITRETGYSIAPIMNQNGYYKVSLSNREDPPEQLLLHRLVAAHFIPNPYLHPQVNHKDGVKANNQADNLEWISAEGNVQHALRTGLTPGYMAWEDRVKYLHEVLDGRQVGELAVSINRRPETMHKMLREAAKKLSIHNQWEEVMKENRRVAAIRNLEKINSIHS